MPNREIVVKITTDVDSAKAGVKGLGDEVKGLGTAGAAAQSGLDPVDEAIERINAAAEKGTLTAKQFEEELSKIPKPLADVARAVVESQIALNKMAEAGDKGPRALARAAGEAQVKVETLKKALEDAERAGLKVGPDIAAGMKQAESEISRVATQAARAKDAMGDLAARSKLSAEGFEAAAGSASSFSGMLGAMANSSIGAAGALAKVGVGVSAVVAAFLTGLEVGKAVDAWLKQHGVNLGEMASKYVAAALGVKDYGEKIAGWNIHGKSQVAIANEQKIAFGNLAGKLAESSAGMAAFFAKQQEGARLVGALNEILKTFGGNLTAQADFVKKFGKAMDDDFIKAMKDGTLDTKTLTKEQKALLDAIVATGDAAKQAAEKLVAAKKAEVAEAQKSATAAIVEMNAKLKALNEMTVSEEEYGAKKKAIVEAMQAALSAASAKEAEMHDLQKKKLGEVDASYKGVSQTVGELTGTQEANTTATDASGESMDRYKTVSEGITRATGEATTAVTDHTKAHSDLADAAGKSAGVTDRSAKAFESLSKNATEAGKALPSVATGLEKSDTAAGKLATSGASVKMVLGEIQKQADESAASLRRWAEAADGAAKAAARAAGVGTQSSHGGSGGGGGSTMAASH